jgi:hypothetical protein
MAKTQKKTDQQTTIRHLSWAHFAYIFAFAASIIAFHGGNLLPPDAIMRRWTATIAMLIVTTFIWYYARTHRIGVTELRGFVFCLAAMDMIFAGYLVYAERGMASLGVALFALPIAVIATLANRAALWAAASLCLAVYSYAAIRYFFDYFNEGYKLQLYATIGFYGALFFVLAGVLVIVSRARKP